MPRYVLRILVLTWAIALTLLALLSGNPFYQNYEGYKGLGMLTRPKSASSQFTSTTNDTMGFSEIAFIRLPHRYDQEDVMTFQGLLAKLKYNSYDAVDGQDIEKDYRGLPPARSQDLSSSEMACIRSHANVWQKMLQNNYLSVLVLEGDATFDVDIRDQTFRLAGAFQDLLSSLNLTVNNTDEDPWNCESWDILNFGACFEGGEFSNLYRTYDDPGTPSILYDYPETNTTFETKEGERIVRRSGRPICTTGYGISRRGALKMLLRMSLESSRALDLVMAQENLKGKVESYTVWPPLIQQWKYKDGVNTQSSDIHNVDKNKEYDPNIWKDVILQANVWQVRKEYQQWHMNNWTLAQIGRESGLAFV